VREENPSFTPDVVEWSKSQYRLMSMESYFAFIAVENGLVVGFNNGLVLTDPESGNRYVEGGNFYVLPEYRKMAAGMKLHKNSFDVAKSQGAKWLRRHVSVNNKRMVDRMQHNKRHILKEYVVDEMLGGVV
jgi:GNAT superfamily N-acetyltransferase